MDRVTGGAARIPLPAPQPDIDPPPPPSDARDRRHTGGANRERRFALASYARPKLGDAVIAASPGRICRQRATASSPSAS